VPFVRGDWLVNDFATSAVAKEMKPIIEGDQFRREAGPASEFGPIVPIDRFDSTELYAAGAIRMSLLTPSILPTQKRKTSFRVGERVLLIAKANKDVLLKS